MTTAFHIALPATSANLGPAFDTAALAWDSWLRLTATASRSWRVEAMGREAELCARLDDHLIVNVYSGILARHGLPAVPLELRLENGIPIGKGCGSSAAARLAGVALASHFGGLGWPAQRIFEEAVRSEGHPDNVAACWWGGLVVAQDGGEGNPARWLRVPAGGQWELLLAVPPQALATSESRRVLPAQYSRADVTVNLQNTALLLQAWQQGREELLAHAMQDRLHQPYRAALCPLLPALAPLVSQNGILGCALSGAGPAVVMIVRRSADAIPAVAAALESASLEAELLAAKLVVAGPGTTWGTRHGCD
ncbi:MAG: homoserine kinase [Terriglobales bacterium]